jgi:hypothetical protein
MSSVSPPTSASLAEIKRYGYWEVRIRPVRFDPHHAGRELARLEEIVQRSSVLIRGWDFPHISNRGDFDRGIDWVGQSTAFGFHREIWRLYLSGQFVFLGSLWDDWLDQSHWRRPPPEEWAPGTRLSIYEALYGYAEIYDFASRLAVTPAGSDECIVATRLRGLRGRYLITNAYYPSSFADPRPAAIDTFPHEDRVSREELVASPREFAMSVALGLFQTFGWDTNRQYLQSLLDELKG